MRKKGPGIGVNEILLTPAQAAERLQITERTVYEWLREGRLPGHKIGRLWRIDPKDLRAFLEGSRTHGAPKKGEVES